MEESTDSVAVAILHDPVSGNHVSVIERLGKNSERNAGTDIRQIRKEDRTEIRNQSGLPGIRLLSAHHECHGRVGNPRAVPEGSIERDEITATEPSSGGGHMDDSTVDTDRQRMRESFVPEHREFETVFSSVRPAKKIEIAVFRSFRSRFPQQMKEFRQIASGRTNVGNGCGVGNFATVMGFENHFSERFEKPFFRAEKRP